MIVHTVWLFRLDHPLEFRILKVCSKCKHYNTDYDMPFCEPGVRTPSKTLMGCNMFKRAKKMNKKVMSKTDHARRVLRQFGGSA